MYGAAAILTAATTIILLPLYTHLLTPGEIGQIELLTIVTTIVHVSVALEIAQGLARHLPEAVERLDRRAFASTAFDFTAVAYTLLALVGLAFAAPIAAVFLGSEGSADLVRVAIVATFAAGFMRILLADLRGELRPKAYAVVSILYTVIAVGGAVVLLGLLHTGPQGVFIAQALGAAVGAIVAVRSSSEVRILGAFDRNRLREMLAFSMPLVPSSLGVIVAWSIDRIAIGQLMGVGDVGIFSVGFRIAQAGGLLMVAFQLALTPLIYQRHASPETRDDLERIFRVFVGFAVVVCLAVGLFGGIALALLAPADYAPAAGVIAVLAPAILLANMYVFAPGLGIAKRSGLIAVLSLGVAALNTCLAFALIPILGIYGAATATLIGSATSFVAYMVMSQRTYPVPHRWPRLLSATIIAIGLLVAGTLVRLPPAAEFGFRSLLLFAEVGVVFALGLIEPAVIRGLIGTLRGSRAP